MDDDDDDDSATASLIGAYFSGTPYAIQSATKAKVAPLHHHLSLSLSLATAIITEGIIIHDTHPPSVKSKFNLAYWISLGLRCPWWVVPLERMDSVAPLSVGVHSGR